MVLEPSQPHCSLPANLCRCLCASPLLAVTCATFVIQKLSIEGPTKANAPSLDSRSADTDFNLWQNSLHSCSKTLQLCTSWASHCPLPLLLPCPALHSATVCCLFLTSCQMLCRTKTLSSRVPPRSLLHPKPSGSGAAWPVVRGVSSDQVGCPALPAPGCVPGGGQHAGVRFGSGFTCK